jgi:hypothetical protein
MAKGGKGGGGADPTVDGVVPDSSFQGVTLEIEVDGSGFDASAGVALGIAGNPVSSVVTNSTTFVDSTTLFANITIAPDADTVDYDVIVAMSKGRKGIGTLLFKVKKGNPQTPRLEATIHDTHPMDGATSLRSDGHGTYVDGVCGFSGGYTFPEPDNPMLGFGLMPQGAGGCDPIRSAQFTLALRHVENPDDPDDHSGDFAVSALTMGVGSIKVRPVARDAEHPAGRGALGSPTNYCKPNLKHKHQNWPFRFNPGWSGGDPDPLYPYSDVFVVTETDWSDPTSQQDPIAWTVRSKPYPENVIGCIRGPEIEYWHLVVSFDARVPQ